MTLDRRAGTALLVLVAAALLVNIDRFVAGPEAFLRAHDVSDNTVTGLASCGDFWRSGLQSVWDPAQLRGWPRAASSQHPQILMCVVGGIVSPAYILPTFHVLLLAVIAAGAYLFVHAFLRRSHEAAVAGSVLNVALYFFFHEHPIVPSAILLPPLAGFLAVPVNGWRERVLLFTGAALVMGLSNPPPTLILMPVAHLVLIATAPRGERRTHVVRWAVFWFLYGIYYLPTMISMLLEFPNASRSLYKPAVVRGTFREIFIERLLNPAVLTPGAVLVALIGRRTWKGTLLVIAGILAFITLSAVNQVLVQVGAERFPMLISLQTTYYRMYYFVPIAVLVWAAWLFDDIRAEVTRVRIRHALFAAAFCAAVVLATSDASRVFVPYWRYAAVIAALGVGCTWWTARPWSVALVVLGVFLFGRYEFTRIYEVPNQGNLFVEADRLGQGAELARAVTVMGDCDAVDVFPAQARAAGMETLDGIANYYSRGFVERWRYFVADNPFSCTSRYAVWNTRTELTLDNVPYNVDRVVSWLWINNVSLVRSIAPITHPRLKLVDERSYRVDGLQDVRRYLYRLEGNAGRVFTIPADAADRASGVREDEEAVLAQLDRENSLGTIRAQARSGSHLRFRGAFPEGTAVVANVNYHAGWRLYVDDQPSKAPVTPGPFGMIRVPVVDGDHVYDLRFSSWTTALVPVFMAIALAGLWIVAGQTPSPALERIAWTASTRGLPAAALLGGIILMTMGFVRSREPQASWLAGGWTHRMALATDGVAVTAPVRHLPVRVEIGQEATAFWDAVGTSADRLAFSDASGATFTPWEIESFDPGARRMVAWVRAPELRPGPQTFAFVYFGGADAPAEKGRVWDEHYTGVWHVPPPEADGNFNFGDEDWTLEFAVRPEPYNGRNYGLVEHGPPGAFTLYLHTSRYPVLERRNGAATSEVGFAQRRIEASEWWHVMIGRTRHQLRIAINGRPVESTPVVPPFAHAALTGPLKFGSGRYGPLDGELREVRITRGRARSADWSLASYSAQQPSFTRLQAAETRR